MKNKQIYYTFLIILIGILLSIFFRIRSRDIYYYPLIPPKGYEEVKPENNVISDSLGIGFVVKFENKDKILRITTYKKPYDFLTTCRKGDIGRYSNVNIYNLNGVNICSYDYKDDLLTSRQYYLLKESKVIRIYEENQPFLGRETVDGIISSLSVRYR